MASYGWRETTTVEEGLFQEGHRFDFFQAVRLIEHLWQLDEADRDAAETEVGWTIDLPLLFRSNPGFAFPSSDVDSVERAADGSTEMSVNFMGLAGPLGPLPSSFGEWIMERQAKRDFAMRDFLDVFNNRLVAIAYRARRKMRPSLHLGRPEESELAAVLYSLIGLRTDHLRGRLRLREGSLLAHAGILARKSRSMIGMVRILASYFQTDLEVEPFQGAWFALAGDQITEIGVSGQNQVLGESVVLGSSFWDQQAAYRLTLGPLSLQRFLDFLPPVDYCGGETGLGSCYIELSDLSKFYAGDELIAYACLRLSEGEMPPFRLGASDGARLGWTSWLTTEGLEQEDRQVVLRTGRV